MKDFWKNITPDRMGIAFSNLFLAFLFSMAWVVIGVVFFGIIFQWILLLIIPKPYYEYALSGFVVAWLFLGFWYAFIYLPKQEKKPES